MATPPPGANFEAVPPPPLAPPGTDMMGICPGTSMVFDYFALFPFYDWTCNNEQLRMGSIHPLDITQLSKMTGIEYMLGEVMEPHLFVFCKQKRDSPEKVTPMLSYYLLDGAIYQAPPLCNIFAARILIPKTRVQLLNQRALKRLLTLKKSSKWIIFLPPYSSSHHRPLHLHHFQKVELVQQQLEKLTPALKPNKQESRKLLSTPSSIKVQLKE